MNLKEIWLEEKVFIILILFICMNLFSCGSSCDSSDSSSNSPFSNSGGGYNQPPPTSPQQTIFSNVTPEAGVDGNNGYTCGCGVNFNDLDGDGFEDILVLNYYPAQNVVYRNFASLADLMFKDISKIVGLTGGIVDGGEGVVSGDIDNDGNLDIYIIHGLGDILLQNQGTGVFNDITSQSGISINTIPCGIALLDVNNDGCLDFYRQGHHDDTGLQSRCDGSGLFDDMTSRWGIDAFDNGDRMGISTADFDNDGDMDVYVGFGPEDPGDSGENVLYRNDGGFFTNVAPSAGVNDSRSAFSSCWGDYDNDGWLDLYVTNNGQFNTSTKNILYHNNGNGSFIDVTDSAKVGNTGRSVGCVFLDYDNDGWLDIYIANGSLDRDTVLDPNTLYYNNGDGTFTNVSTDSGADDAHDAYSLTSGDYNNDGYMDLYLGMSLGEGNKLFLNNGGTNKWLELNLTGKAGSSNLSAIGARINVVSGGMSQIREVTSVSPGNHQSLKIHFGLGKYTKADLVKVQWPSGTIQTWSDVSVDQMMYLQEQ